MQWQHINHEEVC